MPPEIFAEPWPAVWVVLITPPQGELAATAWLARQGVTEAWHPTETIYIRNRFAKDKRIPRIKPIATGYLFARFARRPIWDFLFAQSNRKIADVMHIGENPVALADADLMQMKQMPDRITALRQAAIDAATIREGDMATITGGPMDGWTVTVDRIGGGMAFFEAPIGRTAVAVDLLQKRPLAFSGKPP
jgi:hypothetical protein